MINIKDFLVEFSDTFMRQGDAEFVKGFPFNYLSTKVKEEKLAA